MPESLHRPDYEHGSPNRAPSENLSFLEPGNLATEFEALGDAEIAREEREGLRELQEPQDFIKKRLGPAFWIAASWILLVVFLAVFASWLPFVQDPTKIGIGARQGPSPEHWLGTDNLGRDIFARLVYGARVSLLVGVGSVVLGMVVGGTIGVVSGYFRRWYDTGLMALMDVILAFPPLLLALSIVTFRNDRSVPNIVLAIGIVAIPAVARLVRANTLSFREREFVLAARNLGASHLRILMREIVPNVVPAVISFAVIGIAVAITAESGLAYLGASVNPPQPTWGGMISAAKGDLELYPAQVFIPCAVLAITVLSLYLAGDRLNRYFDVKEAML